MLLFAGRRWAGVWTLLAIALSALVVYNSAIYFTAGPVPVFLLEKGEIARLPLWRAAFYFHVVSACVCLTAGAPLMFPRLLRHPRLHRALGYVYLNSVLFAAAPSALLLAPLAKGGLLGAAGFGLAGVLWWLTTMAGFRAIVAGDVPRHIRAMLRSDALALSAPAFRVIQVALFWLGVAPETNYVASLWLSVAASFWLSETCIHRHLRPRRTPAAASYQGALS